MQLFRNNSVFWNDLKWFVVKVDILLYYKLIKIVIIEKHNIL